MPADNCFICRKHQGEIAPPPGGYLWEDHSWLVCHAPAEIAGAGTLILEARQHFLDLEDMPADERASFGPVLARIYPAIRRGTGAERVYLVSTMGRVAHFHAWLVPGCAARRSGLRCGRAPGRAPGRRSAQAPPGRAPS